MQNPDEDSIALYDGELSKKKRLNGTSYQALFTAKNL